MSNVTQQRRRKGNQPVIVAGLCSGKVVVRTTGEARRVRQGGGVSRNSVIPNVVLNNGEAVNNTGSAEGRRLGEHGSTGNAGNRSSLGKVNQGVAGGR